MAHRQHRYVNNCAENSHPPTRQRERRMQGFKSPGHAQRFLSAGGLIAPHFRPRRRWMRVGSRASTRVMAGRMVVRRSASVDLLAPGGTADGTEV